MSTEKGETPHPLVGTTIGGYQIVREVARGGMGVILEAKHPTLGQRAAVKVLSDELLTDPKYNEFYRRFVDEAKAIGVIQHPGLVKVYDQGQLPNGSAYILMEFLDGESLDKRIARGPFQQSGTWLPVSSVLRIARQLVSALAEAHRKSIVHRDLKPGNVILVPDPEAPGGERTKLLDFGIARFLDSGQSISRTGTIMGTPLYMSPQQCMGEKVDGKADVYALGAMMFEMLSGHPPFEGNATSIIVAHVSSPPPDLSREAPKTPREVKLLVEKLLDKDPAKRPTMLQLLEDLRQLERAHPMEAAAQSVGTDANDPTRMHPEIKVSNEAATQISVAQPGRSASKRRANTLLISSLGLSIFVLAFMAWLAMR